MFEEEGHQTSEGDRMSRSLSSALLTSREGREESLSPPPPPPATAACSEKWYEIFGDIHRSFPSFQVGC